MNMVYVFFILFSYIISFTMCFFLCRNGKVILLIQMCTPICWLYPLTKSCIRTRLKQIFTTFQYSCLYTCTYWQLLCTSFTFIVLGRFTLHPVQDPILTGNSSLRHLITACHMIEVDFQSSEDNSSQLWTPFTMDNPLEGLTHHPNHQLLLQLW